MKIITFLVVCLAASTCASPVPAERGFNDFILNTLGLQSVWEEIVELGNGFVGQVIALGTQLIFAGQQALANAKPILAQLVSDLTNHTGNAVTIVQQAIQQLTQVVGK